MLNLAGIEVIVKLFENTSRKDITDNSLMTRTLGKIAVLNKDYKLEEIKQPAHEEFWRCKIIKETKPSQNKGCFILNPIKYIDQKDIFKLVPGIYDEYEENGTLLITPHQKDLEAILPLTIKRNLKRVNSIIVALNNFTEK